MPDGPAPVSHSYLLFPLHSPVPYVPEAPGCISGLSEVTEYEEARGGRGVPVACLGQFSNHRMEASREGRGLWVERGDWS